MSADETVVMTAEDRLAAAEAATDARVPHNVALAIIGGVSPIRAFRDHHGLTVRQLSDRSGVAVSYLSEIENGRKPGSVTALSRVADVLGTSIEALVND